MSSEAAPVEPEATPATPEPVAPLAVRRGRGVALSERCGVGRFKNIPVSPQKLNDLCRVVRGLSVEEAYIQTDMMAKKKAFSLRNTIRNAKNAAVHNQHLDPARLVVAEAYVGSGEHVKRRKYRAKGRADLINRYRSHLTVVVREVPVLEGEKRVGRAGMRHDTLQRTLERLAADKKAAQQ